MCINYVAVGKQTLQDHFDALVNSPDEWSDEVYQDYLAPILIADPSGRRAALPAGYGMVPKRHIPPDMKRYSTMNARAETIAERPSYALPWRRGQLCLVPMHAYFEPNWETGSAVRWRIGMADDAPFAVAGLYRAWQEADGSQAFSFTQLTVNADEHPLMKRFHRPEDEKRSLVIIPRTGYDEWLTCRNPEQARAYLQTHPAELMAAAPDPKPAAARVSKRVVKEDLNGSLF
ncbi:SOS response-associated peptidase [Undibacterium sp.]|jgi:putative SOS response-associated peptidase YedK|uniref:SOS response-associated peptidase n=1 Tax=Undibacterium sp. TaxID=1914977 RepID=UPI002BFD384C|nr:SOS response-associated peptidase family protein [Undibacterium sp.]HTD06383.1 SOS response-associated peptidase family protein [Undibacterium sp.]